MPLELTVAYPDTFTASSALDIFDPEVLAGSALGPPHRFHLVVASCFLLVQSGGAVSEAVGLRFIKRSPRLFMDT